MDNLYIIALSQLDIVVISKLENLRHHHHETFAGRPHRSNVALESLKSGSHATMVDHLDKVMMMMIRRRIMG